MNDKLKIPDITKKINDLNIIYYGKNMELDEKDIDLIIEKNYNKIYLFDYRLGILLYKNNRIDKKNAYCIIQKYNIKT